MLQSPGGQHCPTWLYFCCRLIMTHAPYTTHMHKCTHAQVLRYCFHASIDSVQHQHRHHLSQSVSLTSRVRLTNTMGLLGVICITEDLVLLRPTCLHQASAIPMLLPVTLQQLLANTLLLPTHIQLCPGCDSMRLVYRVMADRSACRIKPQPLQDTVAAAAPRGWQVEITDISIGTLAPQMSGGA